MKLFDLNDKEFEVTYNRVTGKVSKVFYDCMAKMPQNNAMENAKIGMIISKYIDNDLFKSNPDGATTQAMNKAFQLGEITIEDIDILIDNNKDLTQADKIKRDNLYLEMFKAMIADYLLANAHKELIQSNIDSEFWQNQNLQEVRTEVDKFRAKVN